MMICVRWEVVIYLKLFFPFFVAIVCVFLVHHVFSYRFFLYVCVCLCVRVYVCLIVLVYSRSLFVFQIIKK